MADLLHDILLALLGFTGDIIVEEFSIDGVEGKRTTFHVRDGYPDISDAERDQIDKIVPLGWYYLRFDEYMKKYDISWDGIYEGSQMYRMAICAALQDLQQEYMDDIANLEEILNLEESLPLSHFLHHVQKVFKGDILNILTFPSFFVTFSTSLSFPNCIPYYNILKKNNFMVAKY